MLEALSRFELRAGNIDAAVAAADRAARTHDDPFLAELAAFVRVSGVAQGSTPATPYLAEGAARYRDLVDTWPQRGPSRVGLGVALALMGDADAAIRELLVAAELGPASAEPWSNLAQIYLRRGETEQAREAVREGLSRVPDDEPLLALNQQLEEA